MELRPNPGEGQPAEGGLVTVLFFFFFFCQQISNSLTFTVITFAEPKVVCCVRLFLDRYLIILQR